MGERRSVSRVFVAGFLASLSVSIAAQSVVASTSDPSAEPRGEPVAAARERSTPVTTATKRPRRQRPTRTVGPAGTCTPVVRTLSNGSISTDGSLTIGVDGLGAFGSRVFNNPADTIFNPIGPDPAASAVYTSNLYLSSVGGLLNDSCSTVEASSATKLVTSSDLGTFSIRLTQTLSAVRNGSALKQVYAITNDTGSIQPLTIARHLDGDLYFVGDFTDDGGAASANGSNLYEFEWSGDHTTPATYVGISGNLSGDRTPDRWTIQPYYSTSGYYADTLIANGGIPSGDSGHVSTDAGGDGMVDSPFDVTLTQQWGTFVPARGKVTFTTLTRFGDATFDETSPSAAFIATWKLGQGNKVWFNGTSSENATSWTWDFGDGSPVRSAGPEPEHTYATAGEKLVSLTVGDGSGQTDTYTDWITVNPVRTYAPMLMLDGSEDRYPLSAERYLQTASLRWRHMPKPPCRDFTSAPAGTIDLQKLGHGGYARRVQDLLCQLTGDPLRSDQYVAPRHPGSDLPSGEKDEGFYLDGNNSPSIRNGRTDVSNVPIYFEYARRRFIVFWFFYPYNDHGNKHESDWEHITVRLDARGRMLSVAYYQHGCEPVILRRRGTELNVDNGLYAGETGRLVLDTHPLAWVADGSHATYWRRWGATDNALRSNCAGPDTADGSGVRWRTWQGSLINAQTQPWYGYGGLWGWVVPLSGNVIEDFVLGLFDGTIGPSERKLGSAVPSGWNTEVAGRRRR